MGIIYKVTNKINGKSYIGQSINALHERKKSHKHGMKFTNSFVYFHNALRKYGWDNFIWEILENCLNNKLNKREVYYIDKFNTFNIGYNLTPGGDFNPMNIQEIRNKVSQAQTGKILSKETRKKISESLKGRKYSKQYKENMSKIKSKILWLIETPTGEKFHLFNCKNFAKEHNLNFGWLSSNGSCKGYKAVKKIV